MAVKDYKFGESDGLKPERFLVHVDEKGVRTWAPLDSVMDYLSEDLFKAFEKARIIAKFLGKKK